MKFLFVVMGYIEADRPGISGGDVRWLKFASWLVRQGHEVTVFSTDNCRRFIEKYDPKIKFLPAGNMGIMSTGGGLRRLWCALTCLRKIRTKFDHVYSVSTILYDVLPGFLLSLFRGAKWTVVCHWIAPLFGRQTRFLHALLFYLGDRAGLLLTARANYILCVSEPTRLKVLKFPFLSARRISGVECGVEMKLARDRQGPPKNFTAVHIKRVAKTKGSFDLPPIWKLVVQRFPTAKLYICGDGAPEEISTLKSLIKKNGMEDNIEYRGPIYDEVEKFQLLHSCQCFLLPSYEENWAIVLGEALASGLEVLCYDLPDIRPVWGDSLHWIPVGDIQNFADRICAIFEGKLTKKGGPPPPALKSWDDVYAQEYEMMTRSQHNGAPVQHE
jgi:glycosyltransferase involved in cell wall biosynthesis